MNEEFPEPTPGKSNRRTMLIGGVSAVLLGCCALVAVVVLVVVVDPFDLNILSRLNGRYDAAATAMPADTVFYAGLNLLNLNPEEIERVVQPFIEAVDDPEVENLPGVQDEFSQEVETEFGINIETDVVPWVGQYIGFGITEFTFGNSGEVESVQWILAAEARNRDAADEFLIKLRDGLARESGNDITEQNYEGRSLYVMQGGAPDEQVAFGRSRGLVIVGANVAAVQAAIDAQNGSSLDESDHYRQIIGELPGGRALTVYSTGDGIRNLLGQVEAADSVPVNPSGLPLTSFASSAVTFSIVEAGLQIDIVSYFDQDQLSSTQQALLEAADQASKTADLFPDQTVGFLNGRRLDLLWLAVREATGDETAFDESMDAFGREFGVNPNTELFPLLNGEWAIGLVADQSGLLAEELEVPLGVVFAVETDRPLEMVAVVDAIRAGLEGQLLAVKEVETNGFTTYQVSLAEDGPPAFNFGVEQGYFFIASSEGTAVETFSGGPALADNDHYQAVLAEFSRNINLTFYLDVRTLLGTLREGQAGFDLLDFNETVQMFEPIEAIGLGNAYDGDLRHSQIIIFIETE